MFKSLLIAILSVTVLSYAYAEDDLSEGQDLFALEWDRRDERYGLYPWSPQRFMDIIHFYNSFVYSKNFNNYCEELKAKFRKYGWPEDPCYTVPWQYQLVSENAKPLIYAEFVNPKIENKDNLKTTLVLGGVHPDELTPVHLAFRFAHEMQDHPELYEGIRVIVAPVVNPDGLLLKYPKRVNASGVDLNRNFPTRDWWAKATAQWHKTQKSDPRRFPGKGPNSEQGTRFQLDLIQRFDPDQIISVHAPLGFLDYDGPGDHVTLMKNTWKITPKDKTASELVLVLSKEAHNYKIKDYPYFPGSLGNYSGNEYSTPTVTLELTSTNPKMVSRYWRDFFPGLKAAIQRDYKKKTIEVVNEKLTD